jgi:CSLREA domain-containing protein
MASRLPKPALISGLAIVLALALPSVAHGDYVVNDTGDAGDMLVGDDACATAGGACTLRAAIQEANSDAAQDSIGFELGGSPPHTISPASALPRICTPLEINGITEPDWAGTPVVFLSGAAAGVGATGLEFVRGGGADCASLPGSTADGSAVRGLAVGAWGASGIHAEMVNVTLATNHIGTNAPGTAASPNGRGIWIEASSTAAGAQGGASTVGGPDEFDGNLISGNTGPGVLLTRGSASGTVGASNVVQYNVIGTDRTKTAALGNGGAGISFALGGSRVRDNLIAHNGGDGIAYVADTPQAVQTSSNQIHSNGGLGIDIADNGVTPNDTGDADGGTQGHGLPQGAQNFPVLTSAVAGATTTSVSGSLNSSPSSDYRIELYASTSCDASGHGEGARLIGSTSVSTDSGGNETFSVTASDTSVGEQVTAIAIRLGGGSGGSTDQTSEFSACRAVAGAPPAQHTLSVGIAGSGTGTVTGPGINCPGDCSQAYDSGSTPELTATASGGSTFTGWSGACSGTGSCQPTMSQARTVTATFTPPPGDIALSPSSLSFGNQQTGTVSAKQEVGIANTGAGALRLTQPSISTNQFQLAATTCGQFPATLAANSSCKLELTFSPTSAGAKSANLTIPSDDPDESSVQVSLSGTGLTPPNASFDPAALGFGSIEVGAQSQAQGVTIENTGDSALVVTSITKVGAHPGDYSLSLGTCGPLPKTLPKNGSCEASVTFAPGAVGARAAALRISSNDPDAAQHDLALSGSGVPPPSPRPDATIRRSNSSSPIGNDLYETSPVAQVVAWSAKVRQARSFAIGLQNDGPVAGPVSVAGCPSSAGFTVKYLAGGLDVTSQVVAGTYATTSLQPGAASELILQVRPKKSRGTLACNVQASAGGQTDVVRATVKAKR